MEPYPSAAGTDTFTFKASDGLSDSNVVIATITIGNHQPVASDATIQTALNTSVSDVLSASDSDGNALTFSIVTNAAKGVATITNAATGAFTYTPNPGASGGDSFTFKVNDGQADSNVAVVNLTIGGDKIYLPLVQR
jgi:Big-like domain-containing protein